jgi:hypothetical protein
MGLPFRFLTLTSLAALAYAAVIRPWHLRWGATPEKLRRPMPLDDRVDAPTSVSTRAITIEARPDQIWPWIAQMGDKPRAGYYSYAWVERAQGMEIEGAERILPEFQTLKVGDALDKKGGMVVQAVEPGRYLVLGPPDVYDWLRVTWAFGLYPIDDHSTRLVTRVRSRFSYRGVIKETPPLLWPFWLLLDPGVFIMERKMLLEIKRLAERTAAAAP